MSEKWETVGSVAKNGKPSKPKSGPKFEELILKNALSSVYLDPAIVNFGQPPEPVKPEKKKEVKSADKPKVDSKKKKEAPPTPPPKPKVPKDITEAVKMNLRVEDLKQLIDVCQTKFPDAPILWLRDLASYLNIKLVNKSSSEFGIFSGEPLSALSPNMKRVIVGMVQSVDVSTAEVYSEIAISNIAHDMAKNLDVLGWVIMAQVIAEVHPQAVISKISRLVDLRNSYQNRTSINLVVLKAIGEAGIHDLQVGIKVWMEVMLPLLNMRNYTKFVVDYITKLLDHHKITETSKVSKPVMDLSNFFTIQDTVFVVASQVNKECAKQLLEQYPRLKNLALAGYGNHELFPELMIKLKSQNMPNQVVDSLDILSHCMIATPAAIVHWQQIYISQLAQSGYLLQYINSKWDNLKQIDSQLFRDTIQAFQEYNLSVSSKKDAVLCQEGCLAILDKISRQNTSRFPWKSVSLLLLLGLAAIVKLDVDANSTFDKSHMGAFLKDAGQYERVCAIRDETLLRSGHLTEWGKKNLPVYYAAASVYAAETYATVSKYAGPAMEQAGETIKKTAVAAQEQLKTVFQMIMIYADEGKLYVEKQAPGLLAAAQDVFNNAKTQTVAAYEIAKVKTVELVGDIDWAKVKDKALVNLEQARTICLQYLDKLIQQFNQLVK